jgi:iron(III) transport system ATP-binding protein
MADRVAFLRNGALEQIGPPADVYLRPASRSVAEFFGPVNAIPAAYMRNVVRTAFGSLRVDSPRSDNGAQDCPCELLVRPHEIALGDSAEESAYALSIPGTITERTFHGEYSELRVRPTVSSDGADPAQVPETITVRVEGNALRHGVGDAVSLRIQAHVVSCCACRPELEGRSTNRDPRSRQGRVKNLLGRLIESARSAATQTR